MFAMVDRPQWNTQRAAEPPLSPELQQMFALARRMGYEMRPIARRSDALSPDAGSPDITGSGISHVVLTWSRLLQDKVFQLQSNGTYTGSLPKADSSLPFRPDGWNARSDGPTATQRRMPTGKRNIGRDLTLTGLHVIDSDHASSSPVILDLHSEYSSASTYSGGSTTPADILTSVPTGDSVDQFPVPDRKKSGKRNLRRSVYCRSRRPQSRNPYDVMIP